MKLGLIVVWRDMRNGVGSGFKLSKWGERDRMIYTIPLQFMFQSAISNCYKTGSERRESQMKVCGQSLQRRCWGMEPPKMASLVVRPLMTNVGVY